MKWGSLAMRIMGAVAMGIGIAEKIKGAPGSEKKQAVLDNLPDAVRTVEFAIDRDIVNDAGVQEAISFYIDSEVEARNRIARAIEVARGLRNPPPSEPSSDQ